MRWYYDCDNKYFYRNDPVFYLPRASRVHDLCIFHYFGGGAGYSGKAFDFFANIMYPWR